MQAPAKIHRARLKPALYKRYVYWSGDIYKEN